MLMPSLAISSSLGWYSSRHSLQTRRTRRWAITAISELDTRNGSTPISTRRVTAPAASLVCTVENTRWPVSEASMAICAVSLSRISPTMMMSGSCRRKARRPLAKVSPIFGLSGIWLMPLSWYSTGSSTVRIFTSGVLMRVSAP